MRHTLSKLYTTAKEVAFSIQQRGVSVQLKAGTALLLQSVASSCNLMFFYLLGHTLQEVSLNNSDNDESEINRSAVAIEYMLYSAAVLTAGVICSSSSRLITNSLKKEYSSEVTSRIITKYSELDLDYTLTRPIGDFVRRIQQIYELQDAVSIWIDDLYATYLELALASGAFFYLDWGIGLTFLGTQFINFMGVCYGSRKIAEIYADNQKISFIIYRKLVARIQNHEAIRLFNRVEIERADGIKELEIFGEGYPSLGFIPERNGLYLSLISIAASIVIITLGVSEKLSFNYFSTIFIYLAQFNRLLDKSAKSITKLLICEAEMTATNQFLMLKKEVKQPVNPGVFRIPRRAGAIEFKNVKFDNGESILNDVSFTIPAGSKAAIIGEGHSIVARLLLRSNSPKEGRIYINNRDISTISDEDLYRAVGIVPQQPKFPNKRLIDILKEAKEEAKLPELTSLLTKVKLDEFEDKLGYKLDESGAKWSKGQLHKLAIAKALLRKPNILIFDEATSALGMEAALEVLTVFEKETKSITTITITHNVLSINNADCIIVLDGGRVIQQGTFEQLKADKEGHFYHLLVKFCEINRLDVESIKSRSLVEHKEKSSSSSPILEDRRIRPPDILTNYGAVDAPDIKAKAPAELLDEPAPSLRTPLLSKDPKEVKEDKVGRNVGRREGDFSRPASPSQLGQAKPPSRSSHSRPSSRTDQTRPAPSGGQSLSFNFSGSLNGSSSSSSSSSSIGSSSMRKPK